jgi:glycosyltransferase involved in cell wall biosynthesis
MKILILSQHYWPESMPINEVAISLKKHGCDITVLTGKPNYPDGAIFPGYRAAGTGCESHKGIPIYRVPLVPRGHGTASKLILNYLSFLASASIAGPWLLRKQRFDVIFVFGSSPILQAIAGLVLKWMKGAVQVTWIQDLWPQSLEATGFVRDKRVLWIVRLVVQWIYRRSDMLLIQSEAFRPIVTAMAGRTPTLYHPNPGRLEGTRAEGPALPGYSFKLGFNVIFAGNLGRAQALETIIGAATLLARHKEIRFVLIGSGSRSQWLQQTVEASQLANVEIPGRFLPEAMPAVLSQASALLVTLSRSPILGMTVPSKLQTYLAAGKPIIAALDGEGARVVSDAGAGVAVPAEDAQALANAVLRLQRMSQDELNEMGERGRKYYKAHFDPDVLIERLVSRFEETISRALEIRSPEKELT